MNFKRILALSRTTIYWFKSFRCVKKSSILNSMDTVDLVLKDKKSLIRYGDGEFFIMEGNSIHYQEYSDELKDNLLQIASAYIKNQKNSQYLLCMPKRYFDCSGLKILKKSVYIRSWVKPRFVYKRKYDTNVTYGDAFLFSKENEKIYEKLWNNEFVENIVFVHNNEKYALEFGIKYGKSVTFVKIPPMNAFFEKENLLDRIIMCVENKTADLVLVSAGPCAKYIVQQLSKRDIWAIDTGHCWDDPLI